MGCNPASKAMEKPTGGNPVGSGVRCHGAFQNGRSPMSPNAMSLGRHSVVSTFDFLSGPVPFFNSFFASAFVLDSGDDSCNSSPKGAAFFFDLAGGATLLDFGHGPL